MVFRDGDEPAKRRAARDALTRLAQVGRLRSERGDRPREPPTVSWPSSWIAQLPFELREDVFYPIDERPGMTHTLLVSAHPCDVEAADEELARAAVRSVHPFFDTERRKAALYVMVPASKLAHPGVWVRLVIRDVLTVLHEVAPIRIVVFGREPKTMTGGPPPRPSLHWDPYRR